MVRAPEQAISPARRTIAYLITGEGDEASAGVARAAIESGAFGSSWVFGADGTTEVARDRAQALEVLAAQLRLDRAPHQFRALTQQRDRLLLALGLGE